MIIKRTENSPDKSVMTKKSLSAPSNAAGCSTKAKRTIASRSAVNTGHTTTISSLPDELMLQILAHLEACDLLSCARVCKWWLYVSKDNLLWQRIFMKYATGVAPSSVVGKCSPAYWKSLCIKRCREVINTKVLPLLKKVDTYTGLPANTQQALGKAGVRWFLCFEDKDGVDHVMLHNDVYYFRMCACARWYGMTIPPLYRIRKLKIYAANPIFFEKSGAPAVNSPCQRSLLFETEFKWNDWTRSSAPRGSDDLINIHIIPGGLLIATWKDGKDIAFVTANLHASGLVKRCLLGTSTSAYVPPHHKPVKDDIDSKYGLHDYTCTIELRNQRNSLWNQQFRNLYVKQGDICGGVARLVLIDADDQCHKSSVAKKIAFLWKTDAFKGSVQNVCFMDLTLLDERSKPMWCVSSVVTVTSHQHNDVTYSFTGDKTQMIHEDEKGRIVITLSWEEDEEMYYMIGLELHVNLTHINQWFATKY